MSFDSRIAFGEAADSDMRGVHVKRLSSARLNEIRRGKRDWEGGAAYLMLLYLVNDCVRLSLLPGGGSGAVFSSSSAFERSTLDAARDALGLLLRDAVPDARDRG